ncbi:peptidase S8 [Streptomyces sp. SID625]|nr:peptidase S8 [Streptomyces sp. SID625]
MRRLLRVGTGLGAILAATLATAVPTSATPASATTRMAGAVPGPQASAGLSAAHDVCPTAAPGHARCYAQIRTDPGGVRGVRSADALPAGYGPADLRAAYDLPDTGGAGQTVAVVVAGDDATAEADLAVYRTTYGLPACTTANGCFSKVNQKGAAGPLPEDMGWEGETALDLAMVSAACPQCHILLVESDDTEFADFAAAENTAARLGATEISNSYGDTESGSLVKYASAYSHPGVAITVASGDSGYGLPSFPADLDSVVSVGGTMLKRADNARGWNETVWNSQKGGAGSGCSAWVDKPAWQHDANCPGRMVADVAAVADPDTGVAIYDSLDGWSVGSGTSASAPLVAGIIGLAGHPEHFPDASYLYAHSAGLNDVVAGSNVLATDCGGDYQCTGQPGYDGPTGLGTPAGLSAF